MGFREPRPHLRAGGQRTGTSADSQHRFQAALASSSVVAKPWCGSARPCRWWNSTVQNHGVAVARCA